MDPHAYWIVRYQKQILIDISSPQGPDFLLQTEFLTCNHTPPIWVGQWQGAPCYTTDIDRLPEHLSAELISLRQLYSVAGPQAFALAGRATQLIDWQSTHRFCGRCGTPTEIAAHEHAMRCHQCGLTAYPRITPAIMVLVRRGTQLLLARSPHFKPGVFSALAGFVEPGETLEDCIHREVMEEVGVEIRNLRYFDSQSWPFPNSLMVAFLADHAYGDIRIDPHEIEAADWFDLDNLPRLPDRVSIARRLIEGAIREMAGE